ncbi:MAG: phosphatidylglycerol lysyltransferase domain-containing protein [Muribaculum sp.]
MDTITLLKFRPVTVDAVSDILPLLHYAASRTCDYTLAGILMWADYFNYEYAIVCDTLFIRGVAENDKSQPAFSMPIGRLPLRKSLAMIRDYCAAEGIRPMFSAVPEDRLPDFYCLGACRIEELTDWADYLYDAGQLAALAGNKYSKKRNHVNRFIGEHPGYSFEPITDRNIDAVKAFYASDVFVGDDRSGTAGEERRQVFGVLDNYDRLPFEGAVLSTPEEGIVAFTVGEVIGDTLFVHIEKMNHTVNGAGETINKLFASAMASRYGVTYINREEDVGDEGLRKAKQSYHPVMMLKKYNLSF